MGMQEKVIVLDFGSHIAQGIARRIRDLGVYSELHPYTISATALRSLQPVAIILSGGPTSALSPDAPSIDPEILNSGLPVLGVGYGLSLMTRILGGELAAAQNEANIKSPLTYVDDCPLWSDITGPVAVSLAPGDKIVSVPEGFAITATTQDKSIVAMADKKRKLYAFSFHPEAEQDEFGSTLLRNFLFSVVKVSASWTMSAFLKHTLAALPIQVGDAQVVCGLSGGIDSTVVAVLLNKAIGKNLHCIFVDTGLLRAGEGEEVVGYLREHFDLNLHHVQAQERFLSRLAGLTDPEEKRKAIGHTFIEVFEEEAKKITGVKFLAQGTLYPDVVESVSVKGSAGVVKSHHNVGGLPEKMALALVEPLRELFKDEVRKLAQELELPDFIVWRHPFPGPGLAIRVLGEVTFERLEILRQADRIVHQELMDSHWYYKIWQGFAVLLPLKTVGVRNDERTYEHVVALRMVDSIDAMTADWSRVPWEILARISNRIIHEVTGVNRVVYDISSKPPSTIEWE
ncbi:MAG: glutamine-hydrolyzing GMP synthase [Desulfovibrionales bacterium]|nr:glutamine-hydrolyzing GMP synthase [Desulfovibrionales bacterium]